MKIQWTPEKRKPKNEQNLFARVEAHPLECYCEWCVQSDEEIVEVLFGLFGLKALKWLWTE